MKIDHVYIWPCDGIAAGESSVRNTPLAGLFAVKFGKNQLEHALGVFFDSGVWSVVFDGYLIARPSLDWKLAFGALYASAAKREGPPILTGRRVSEEEYKRTTLNRIADKGNGLDTLSAVDLNQIEAIF